MANLSHLTRTQQVLSHLQKYEGQWINGPDLANEEVGGSEGLKRLRELRAEGYPIERRQHPDRGRDIYQYRLMTKEQMARSEQASELGDSVQTTWLDEDENPQDPDELVAAWLQ